MTTILVPLDGSKLAEEVLPHAEDLARRLQATVHLVEVVPPPARLTGSTALDSSGTVQAVSNDKPERKRAAAEEYLSRISDEWKARSIQTTWEVIEGAAAAKIVDAAYEHDCYLIAMSTHGRSGLGQMVFGSVANEVLRQASIPVLMWRPVGISGEARA
ncbi:MAG TPA: universal stress protein [Chloroflexota bacterium]